MTFDTRAPLAIQASRTINVGRGSGGLPTIVWDGFESGDRSAPDGPAPFRNKTGFTWGTSRRASVVSDMPFNGDYSLKFTYFGSNGGATGDELQFSEQRFSIGQAVFPEIWLSFWLRVPTNFYHFGTSAQRNHKIFRLWQDDYSVISEKFGMEFRGDGNGNSNFYIWPGSGGGSAMGGGGNAPFINTDTDRGRWMHLVVMGRIESSPGASDGLIRVWRKWEDESHHTQTHERADANIPRAAAEGKDGWTVGYLMGWHNGGYEEDTEWFVDEVKLSTTSLLED